MNLETAPILRLYKLEIDSKNREKYLQVGKDNMLTSIENEPGTVFMETGHEDEAGSINYVFECYQDMAKYNIHAN